MGIAFAPHLEDNSYASWSYTGFNDFRNRLREHSLAKDIDKFLTHSDCDGILTIAECKKLAPYLRKIVESWPKVNAESNLDLYYDRQMGLKLVEQMEFCINSGQHLRFR